MVVGDGVVAVCRFLAFAVRCRVLSLVLFVMVVCCHLSIVAVVVCC